MSDLERDRIEPTDIPEVHPDPAEHGFFENDEQAAAVQTARRGRRASGPTGIFRDPVVRRMTYVAFGLVILFLITVASALITGVLGTGGPRTLAEKELAVTGAAVRAGSTNAEVWATYISALVADGQYGRAAGVIADARRSLDDSRTADITIAETRLFAAQNRIDDAIAAADAAMKQINDNWESRLAAGGNIAAGARVDGLPANYYVAILLKAYIYRDLGDHAAAVEQFDLYLEKYPTASDILIDRALARIELGDNAGAEEDLREALRFDATNTQALEALDRIGASR
jgi:tetratricopeptide (TPR) repeat protein